MRALNAFFLANYLSAPQQPNSSTLQNPQPPNLVVCNQAKLQIRQSLRNKDRYQKNFSHALTDSLAQMGMSQDLLEIAQPKKSARIWEKAYQGRDVRDIFRARVIINLAQSSKIQETLLQITHNFADCFEAQGIKVLGITDFYDDPFPSGLRLIKIHLQFPDFVAELQIISEKFAKIAGTRFDHSVYEARRKTGIDDHTRQVVLKIQKKRYCPVAIDEGVACKPGDPCYEHWLKA